MRYTKSYLHKLEKIFKELNYLVRYEKGNFHSGYCLVQNRKIVIINRFFDTEAKMNCLVEILSQLQEDLSEISSESKDILLDINKTQPKYSNLALEKL